jgi:hypothetical protein
MHIGQILQCDEGASGLEAAGTVDFASDQTHGTTRQGKAWSRQFVTLIEGSDKIGVTLWNCRVIRKGERICVTGAKTEKDKEGKICLSTRTLDGSAPAPQDTPQTPNTPARDTGVSIERQCVVKGVCEIVARRGGQMDKAEALDWCHHLHHWIQTGRSPAETHVGAQGDQEPVF